VTLAYWVLSALDDDGSAGSRRGRTERDTKREPTAPTPIEDRHASIVPRIRAGDARAFAQSLVHDADVAEELVGDVFAGVWQRRGDWRPVTVESYLFGSVRNRALNHRRAITRADAALTRRAPDELPGAGTVHPAPDAGMEAAERLHALHAALEVLAESQRTLLMLRWQRQMPWDEIARVLGVSSTAVQQQHTRLLKALRATVQAALG
jgi:RNA polymerase sigma-70 factor (ECF subfamily)